jgi:hypothetical protein
VTVDYPARPPLFRLQVRALAGAPAESLAVAARVRRCGVHCADGVADGASSTCKARSTSSLPTAWLHPNPNRRCSTNCAACRSVGDLVCGGWFLILTSPTDVLGHAVTGDAVWSAAACCACPGSAAPGS